MELCILVLSTLLVMVFLTIEVVVASFARQKLAFFGHFYALQI